MTVSRYVEISGDDVASQLGLSVSDMKAELALRGCRAFLDGGIHHARCGQRVALHGQRAEELDFYCLTCAESVTLPVCVLSRIPVAGEPTECAA
ncbi:MAG: hypothetical protein DME12_01160 [Candidatus Rokuibacteriota bacterium]|nr:MAG: hypothetical protein DME12_01160 [Candidatus Rokubacteria bacterium]